MHCAFSAEVKCKLKSFALSSPAAKPIFSTKSKLKFAVGRTPCISSKAAASVPFESLKCDFPLDFSVIGIGVLNVKWIFDSFWRIKCSNSTTAELFPLLYMRRINSMPLAVLIFFVRLFNPPLVSWYS